MPARYESGGRDRKERPTRCADEEPAITCGFDRPGEAAAGECGRLGIAKEKWMNRVDEQEKATAERTVLPALIQIQGSPSIITAGPPRKRRITAFLDHRVSRHLGILSWMLVAVAMAAAKPITAVIAGVVILAGLLIGAIN